MDPATLRDRLTQLQSLADTFAKRLSLAGSSEAYKTLKDYKAAHATPPDGILRVAFDVDDIAEAQACWERYKSA